MMGPSLAALVVDECLFWHFGQANSGLASGLVAQVTVCRIEGVRFAIRENVTGQPSFHVSSNTRWGDKIGHAPAKHRQTLELLAPAEHWAEIARIVEDVDGLLRPVRSNASFTWAFVDGLRRP